MEWGRVGQLRPFGFRLVRIAAVLFLAVGFMYIVVHRFEAYRHCEAKFLKEQEQIKHYRQKQQEQKARKLNGGHKDPAVQVSKQDNGQASQRDFFMSSAFEVNGLGNLMFQYAALLGISKYYEMKPVIPSHLKLNRYFSLSAEQSNETRPGQNWGKIITNKASTFESKVFKIKTIDRDLELVGFFQSWLYFQLADAEVKSDFQFSEPIQNAARKFVDAAKANYASVHRVSSPTVIGIHVRRGDMVQTRFRELGYTTVNVSYIRSAMAYMSSKHLDVLFIVCSDDIGWTRDNITPVNNRTMLHFSTSLDDITDLAVLTMTDHLIMSTGTFSWWAGWLSSGEVVYFKHFPENNSPLSQMFSTDRMDYFCPGWTAL